METSEYGALFRSETREQIAGLNRQILAIEAGGEREALDEAFRIVHTLKGMSAAMGYQGTADLAHGLEHLLERLRRGDLVADGEVVTLLLQAVDGLERVSAEEASGAAQSDAGEAVTEPDAGGVRPDVIEAGAYVRVARPRLDTLLDQTGDLVLARERLLRLARSRADEELSELARQLGRQISELRDEALRLRLVRIGEAFERLPRLVRDAAHALDRRVELELIGEEVELDRSVLEEVADLLVHLLRNAVDHGIEPPAERERAGKGPVGKIRVRASRARAMLVVRVEDDGRGISERHVTQAALEAGLLPDGGATATPARLLDLLTRPGFSTAAEVTELSGRGVGLDVVASRIRELGGQVEVESEEGAGATFTLHLPLAVSIVRTLQVAVGAELVAIPFPSVVELVELRSGEAAVIAEEGGGIQHRGEALPLIDLARIFGDPVGEERSVPLRVVVLEAGTRRLAARVDGFVGLQEAVIRPFEAPRGMLDAFSGAALLGDGRPCLVLDVARLLEHLHRDRSAFHDSNPLNGATPG